MESAPGHLRTLAMVLEYDGTGYHGMQRQTALPTIAAEVERALSTLFGHPVRIVAAGRTDAGVHARGQVISCTTTSDYDVRRLPVAVGAMLREARIAVVRAVERPDGFSARRDALARTYRYRILNRAAPSPLDRLRVFHVRTHLDLEAMRLGAEALVGEHDFAAFCATPPARGTTVRTVTALRADRAGDEIELWVTADSFLHQMVRIIAGTLIDVGRRKIGASAVGSILRSEQRAQAGLTAPAHALCLERVHFAEPI